MCILLFTTLLFSQCDNFPKDPEKTLQTVSGKKMIVGITENKPWTDLSGSAPTGIEVKIIEAIARELHAEIEWVRGVETALMEALKAQELHVVIGGISKKTIWAKEVGLTHPYKKVAITIGVPPEAALPEDIKDREVGVKEGTAMARYVRKKGGTPVRVAQLDQFNGPVAAFSWELKQMGWQVTNIKLHEEQKVFAIIRGENAWVMYLEKFFGSHQKEIDQWLVAHSENEED